MLESAMSSTLCLEALLGRIKDEKATIFKIKRWEVIIMAAVSLPGGTVGAEARLLGSLTAAALAMIEEMDGGQGDREGLLVDFQGNLGKKDLFHMADLIIVETTKKITRKSASEISMTLSLRKA
jgi:hypothetical protein